MQAVPRSQIVERLKLENPWWSGPPVIREDYKSYKHRSFFKPFFKLVKSDDPRRAVVMLGPRRVGKTVMIHQAVQALFDEGVPPHTIGYVSVEHPIYTDLSLDDLVALYVEASGWQHGETAYLFFDEIQYMREWERYLKVMVDQRRELKLIVSGSAAAALRLKSQESGAGRFTEFILPPLTFREYLAFQDQLSLAGACTEKPENDGRVPGIEALNEAFVDYINFGGYPEMLLSSPVRNDPQRFIKSDIIDKVLLRDLPSLYGVTDVQELNRLFMAIAFNTGNEISLEELSQNSGVSKNTIKRYVEYLEAAYLVQVVHRIDQSGKRFRRANRFKVYLSNASMRTSLFAAVSPSESDFGRLVETAVFAQLRGFLHSPVYARWATGEVDLVMMSDDQNGHAIEIKSSDLAFDRPNELAGLSTLLQGRPAWSGIATTWTKRGTLEVRGRPVHFIPSSVYCYLISTVAWAFSEAQVAPFPAAPQ